ncbi:helix-turn-helix domain-containing protein [Mycoplasmatota bacterium]|nr:helix-turn-helix domain-containing protein [Mycoplasmatota bacterium]
MCVLSYLLIESKMRISQTKDMILDVLTEVIDIKDVKSKDYQMFVIYEGPSDVAFEDIGINISSDLLMDFRLYESYMFKDKIKMEAHMLFIEKLLENISFNQFMYLKDIDILKLSLTHITHSDYVHIFKRYIDDTQMLNNIKVYLESNQNMSEAAKKLYIHRNTLIQRIDKFITVTGIDIKMFVPGYVIYYLLTH